MRLRYRRSKPSFLTKSGAIPSNSSLRQSGSDADSQAHLGIHEKIICQIRLNSRDPLINLAKSTDKLILILVYMEP